MSSSTFRSARKAGVTLAVASTLFFTAACGMGGGGGADKNANGDLGAGDYHVVSKEDVVNSIIVDGTVAPIRQTGVSSSMGAPVEKLHVQVGDKVKKGQLLVTMDTSSLPQLQSQGAETYDMVAAGDVKQMFMDASSVIENCLKPIFGPKPPANHPPCKPGQKPQPQPPQQKQGPSEEDVARALGEAHEAGRAQGQAEAQQAIEQQMMMAQEQQAQAPAMPDPATQEMLMQQEAAMQAQMPESVQEYEAPDPEIYAPMDGVVTKIEAEEGSPAAGAIMTISDTSRYLIRASVREADIANVREGNRVTFTTPITDDREFEGRVRRVAPMAEGGDQGAAAAARALQGQGGDSKDTGVMFPVEIEVTGDTKGLRLGGSARVEIITDENKDGLSIPRDAVYDGDKVLVLSRENPDATAGTIEERTVKTGIKNDTDIAVTGGDLKEGDVVIAWPDDYRDRVGEEVKITDDKFGAEPKKKDK